MRRESVKVSLSALVDDKMFFSTTGLWAVASEHRLHLFSWNTTGLVKIHQLCLLLSTVGFVNVHELCVPISSNATWSVNLHELFPSPDCNIVCECAQSTVFHSLEYMIFECLQTSLQWSFSRDRQTSFFLTTSHAVVLLQRQTVGF